MSPKQTSLFGGVDHKADAELWMKEHPDAFDFFCRMALRAAGAGRKFGAKMIWERMRWEMEIEKSEGQKFKLNNNHTAYVMRTWVGMFPQHAHLVELREAAE